MIGPLLLLALLPPVRAEAPWVQLRPLGPARIDIWAVDCTPDGRLSLEEWTEVAERQARRARDQARMAAARKAAADPTVQVTLLREVEGAGSTWGWLQAIHDAARRDRPPARFVIEHESGVSTVSFSIDGRRVVTASMDGTARVWSADAQGEPLALKGHEGPVVSAAFSPDGRRVVTASEDYTSRPWIVSIQDMIDLLWRATTYCLPIPDRMRLLGGTEEEATTRHAASEARVAELARQGTYAPDQVSNQLHKGPSL